MTVKKPYNGGKWTEARMRSFVTSALRRASWPVKYECKRNAFVGMGVNPATGRKCQMFRCSSCRGSFPAKQVQVDHIMPIVPMDGHDSWDKFIERLFCEDNGLQVLCGECHSKKTTIENAERKRRRGKK